MTTQAEIFENLAHIKQQFVTGDMSFAEARLLDRFWRMQLINFKPSDTPETDPTPSPDTPPRGTRPNKKEIA